MMKGLKDFGKQDGREGTRKKQQERKNKEEGTRKKEHHDSS